MKQSRSESGRFGTYSDEQLMEIYYETYERRARSLDGKPYAEAFTNEYQFKAALIMARNSGVKVNVKYVKELVDSQIYKTTTKQARALQPALKEASLESARKRLAEDDLSKSERAYLEKVVAKGGVEYSVWQIQSEFGHTKEALKMISKTYQNLRDEGLSSQAASEIVRTKYRFRGSPS